RQGRNWLRSPGEPAERPGLPAQDECSQRVPGPAPVGASQRPVHFLRQPGLDAPNWRAELAIPFGVIQRKVGGGSRPWVGAPARAVLMSVWRTCWQQGRSGANQVPDFFE